MTRRELAHRITGAFTRSRGARGARNRRAERRLGRGSAELSLVLVAGSLVAGTVFGTGISKTAVEVVDGLTWLGDENNGDVIQVNPATGQTEVRQQVADPGDELGLVEHNGQLYVHNQSTGLLQAFDLSSLLVSGQRRVSPGGAVNTLVSDDAAFVIDAKKGTIGATDPYTTEYLGAIWVAPAGLADVALDRAGVVWALEKDGTLHKLVWSTEYLEFDDTDTTTIERSGPRSVLVAHDEGVTVFGPDAGIVQQVGTGHDFTADAPKLIGDLHAPEYSPSDLVAISAPESGTVVVVTPDEVREIDMDSVDCSQPDTPEVFFNYVYVPCQGQGTDDGKVVQLAPNGTHAAQIDTPGSRQPELVLDDDNLLINAPGADEGRVVRSDGSVEPIDYGHDDDSVYDADVPAPPPSVGDLLGDLLGNNEPPENDQPDQQPDKPDKPDGPRNSDNTPGANPPPNTQTPPGCDKSGNSRGGGKKNCPPPPGGTDPGTNNPNDPGTNDPGTKDPNDPGITDPTDPGTTDPTDPGTVEETPLAAPTSVSASSLPEGEVLVTWAHNGDPAADEFVIRDTTGAELDRVVGTARDARIMVTPGASTTFTVVALKDGTEAASAPSNLVTGTARPGAPTVNGTAAYQSTPGAMKFVVTVTWSNAAANGSPITGYTVTVNGADEMQTSQTSAATTRAVFEWSCDTNADPGCKVGGPYAATVTATNQMGQGEPGVFRATSVPPQPAAPWPPNGTQLVAPSTPSNVNATIEGKGSIDVDIADVPAWQRFPGTCTVEVDGNSQPMPCSTRNITLNFDNGPAFNPSSGQFRHAIVFKASNSDGSATSATYTFESTQPTRPGNPANPDEWPPCSDNIHVTCQIP